MSDKHTHDDDLTDEERALLADDSKGTDARDGDTSAEAPSDETAADEKPAKAKRGRKAAAEVPATTEDPAQPAGDGPGEDHPAMAPAQYDVDDNGWGDTPVQMRG